MANSFIIIRKVYFESILHSDSLKAINRVPLQTLTRSFRFVSVSLCIRVSFAFDRDELNDWNYNKCESRQVLHLLWSLQIEFLSQMNRKLCCFSWACPLRVCKAFVSFLSRKFAKGILLIRKVLLSKSCFAHVPRFIILACSDSLQIPSFYSICSLSVLMMRNKWAN